MDISRWTARLRHALIPRHRSVTAIQGAVVVEMLEDRLMLAGAGLSAQPDFHLQDVNTTSASFDQAVSPRDYLQEVSAWYFGHAT